jgi:hypothetical protein
MLGRVLQQKPFCFKLHVSDILMHCAVYLSFVKTGDLIEQIIESLLSVD